MRSLCLCLGLLAAFVPGNASGQAKPSNPPVWAFYYAWYETPQGARGRWAFWADPPASDKPIRWRSPARPLLGPYDSLDPRTAAWHLRLAEAAGIDAFLVSWWGSANVSGQAFEKTMLPAADQTRVKVALNCELAQFHHDVDHLSAELADVLLRSKDHPSYLRMAGRPVVYLYQVPFEPKLTPQSFGKLRTAVERRVGPVWWALDKIAYMHGVHGVPAAWLETPGIDAFGFYGTFSVKRISTEDELMPFFATYARDVRQTNRMLLLPMHPALDNSRIQSEGSFAIPGREGATLEGFHRAALSAGADVLLLTSFNEWPEGTMVEPSADWPDPYRYLRAIASWKGLQFVPPEAPQRK